MTNSETYRLPGDEEGGGSAAVPEREASCPSYASHVLARQATLRALLNSYLRETGRFDPRGEIPPGRETLPLDAGEPFRLPLLHGAGELIGTLRYFSASGQHRYGAAFFLRDDRGGVTPLDMQDIIQCLLESLSALEDDGPHDLRLRDMREKINNSFARMAAHLDDFQRRHPDGTPPPLDFVGAEQSLYLGHPFHPFPKSSQGPGRRAFDGYGPERGVCFRLHYLAVHRSLLVEAWLEGPDDGVAASVREEARRRLGDRHAEYAVLPMHPWQAAYLLPQRDIAPLLEEGALVDLGALGPLAYPTSSVRSVWVPETRHGYKLPLQVRITNLIRENTLEQSRRTLDAARVIHRLRERIESDAFRVVMETGYQTLDDAHPALAAHRVPAFTVIHRPMDIDTRRTFVVASLLEPYPGRDEPKLLEAIRQGAAGRVPDLRRWFDAYLEISMVPMLRALARTGVSFEAHLQNCQVTLDEGWPSVFHVRDLEGVSLDRTRVEGQAWWRSLDIPADSPLLYSPEIAWKRTQYYFFVNHLGGVVHALASHLGVDEGEFWRLVARRLMEERGSGDARLDAYVDELLHADRWPAKANFLSCFRQRGAAPLFIDVVNPIKASR